jgi:hypothetical protein
MVLSMSCRILAPFACEIVESQDPYSTDQKKHKVGPPNNRQCWFFNMLNTFFTWVLCNFVFVYCRILKIYVRFATGVATSMAIRKMTSPWKNPPAERVIHVDPTI